MAVSLKGWLVCGAVSLAMAIGLGRAVWSAPPPPPPDKPEPPREPGPLIKAMLGEEQHQIEKEIASRMMRRADIASEKKARLEMEIDLRIIERGAIAAAAELKPETNEQAAAWLRAKEIRDAVRGMEDTLAQGASVTSPSQKDSLGQLNKLTFSTGDLKGKDLDEFCRNAALNMVNCVNATPVNTSAIAPMRPKPLAETHVATDQPPTVSELTQEVQKLAAISVPLRQQLLALAAAVSAAGDKDDGPRLYAILSQSIALARGLQSNTAVGNEARSSIENQLAEGIVLFADPRTRDAGKSRIDALGQYRQTLTRIGNMGLSKDQMEQLAPAFTWAQANPQNGAKVLSAVEQYMTLCGKWDAAPKEAAVPASLRKSLEDARSQFSKDRLAFMQAASRISGAGGPGELEQTLDEIQRIYVVADDLQSMTASLETINAYKIRPVGGLEKKITTAAIAAVSSASSPNRNDAQKYLSAVHSLAKLSQTLSAKPLGEIPAAVLQTWAGAASTSFDTRWKAIIVELANNLLGGSIELDKAKVARLELALSLGDALRMAAQLEAVLPKTPAMARWVDWSIDPASLQLVLSPYKESVSGAIFGFASDNQDELDKWTRLSGRYTPLIALILRDSQYAEECQSLPIGFPADIGRLTTPFDKAPFSTERYTSYAVGVWAILERTGEIEAAERLSISLAKRLSHDLHLKGTVDETPARAMKKPRF
jgi:hypothetical protein